MRVVLLERVEKLGLMGDVVDVKPGFARNFLLPQNKALRATPENLKSFEDRRTQIEANNLKRREEAQAVAERLEGLQIVMIRNAGESGQLYGSVNAKDVAGGLSAAGFSVVRQQVVMERPVKMLGFHNFRIRLHPEVDVVITVNVSRSEVEAEEQKRLGRGLIASDADIDDEDDDVDAGADAEVGADGGTEAASAGDSGEPGVEAEAEIGAEEIPADEAAASGGDTAGADQDESRGEAPVEDSDRSSDSVDGESRADDSGTDDAAAGEEAGAEKPATTPGSATGG